MKLLRASDGKAFGGGGKVLSVIAGEANIPEPTPTPDPEPGEDLVAFAIYSEDDYSLIFYGTDGSLPSIGDRFNNKTVTNIYTGFDTDVYSSSSLAPWYSVRSNIITVSFDNSFATIQPASTAYWFYNCVNCIEINLDYLNTWLVQSMISMFNGCSGLTSLDVSNFNTSNVTYMFNMFCGCSGLTSLDVSNFNTSNVRTMNYMFSDCSGLTSLDVSNFNTSNVTTMYCMFYNCSGLTSLDVSKFETSNVTDMSFMFYNCTGLTSLDVSKFETSNVKDMMSMFRGCDKLETIYSANNQFNIDKVTSSSSMFYNCTKLVGGNGTTYDSSKIDASMAHVDTASNPGYFTAK